MKRQGKRPSFRWSLAGSRFDIHFVAMFHHRVPRLWKCVIHISGRIATLSLLGEEVITFGFRDKRTSDFAEESRVKAFTAFEHKAEMKLDQLDPATFLLDLDLAGRVQEIKFVL